MIGFVIHFDTKGTTPKYIQLYEYIKKEIMDGILIENTKLPSIRSLSTSLNVSKSTVENAYNQLMVEGYVESKFKSGYYVATMDTYALNQFSKSTALFTEPIEATMDKKQRFHNDKADEGTFNFTEWKKATNRVLEYQTDQLLSYGDAQGEYALRNEISKFIHSARGGKCHPDQIIVGAGIQYLFGLIATIFRKDHSEIGFEYPGFSKGMYVFEDYGYETVNIPVESDGIDLKKLEKSNVKIVYVSPSHQYPTGSIMPIKKRIQLVNWASKSQAYIIEDDYDSLLRYEGYPVPALQGLNQGKNVIYVGSFSKLLTPALRISFMILPESLLGVYKEKKARYSQSVSKIDQLALADYMAEGAFERHIRRVKKIYGKKNQLLIEAFKKYPSPNLALIGKESGLHVVLSFAKNVCIRTLEASAKKEGITLEAVDEFGGNKILVFPYSGIPDEDVEEVVKCIVGLSIEASKK